MTIVKRFIAGAVCPKCAAMDRIVMYTIDGKQYRECVECDFNDEMRFITSPREIDTRVNRSAEERDQAVQPVKILDPGKG